MRYEISPLGVLALKCWLEEGGRGESMSPDMRDIHQCVVCGRTLKAERRHVDTCGERCFKRLLVQQQRWAVKDSLRGMEGQ